MKHRLSILIPCFNVERYIRKCLDSIFRMKLPYEEFEVLCFDDMSTDGTSAILDEYVRRFTNFRILRATTKVGPGGGRNILLSEAKGQYIWFVDGDDMIEPERGEQLLVKAETEKLDVLVFNYKEWDADGQEISLQYTLQNSIVKRGVELCNEIFKGGIVNNMGFPWRFISSREYLLSNHILFPEDMRYGEDTVWMAKICLYAKRMMSISEQGYIYWHHEDSTCGIMNRSYPGRIIYERTTVTAVQLIEFAAELRERYEISKEEIWLRHSQALLSYTSSHYVNQLPILLFRSSNQERLIYYKLLSAFDKRIVILPYTTLLTWVLMNRWIGPYASTIMSALYKLSHRKK